MDGKIEKSVVWPPTIRAGRVQFGILIISKQTQANVSPKNGNRKPDISVWTISSETRHFCLKHFCLNYFCQNKFSMRITHLWSLTMSVWRKNKSSSLGKLKFRLIRMPRNKKKIISNSATWFFMTRQPGTQISAWTLNSSKIVAFLWF